MPTRPGQIAGPSPGARASGRYAKRHLTFAGFPVSIENEPGTARPRDGNREDPHAQTLVPYAYGYFDSTRGADGEEVDVFLGGDETAEKAYVVAARKPTGGFDEHKVFLGFQTQAEAEACMALAYHDGAAWRMGQIEEFSLDELRSWLGARGRREKSTLVRLAFPARVEKQLRQDEAGQPVLRLLVSGTKLDDTSYQHGGVEVVGERVMPELLATMANEARTGGVYLLENHSATLRMGTSIDAAIVDLPDGDQELYVDFRLKPEHPLVPTLIEELRQGDYVPDCSVGLLVRRVVAFDSAVNAWIGQLTEGHFEHVALTRPDHAAFPDAAFISITLGGDTLAAAMKSLYDNTAEQVDVWSTIQKAAAEATSVQTLIFDKHRFTVAQAQAWAKAHDFAASEPDETEGSVRLRQQDPGAFADGSFRTISLTDGVKAVIGRKKETANKSAAEGREGELVNVKIRKSDPAAATADDPSKAVSVNKEADAESESAKAKEAEAKKEAEAAAAKEAALKEAAAKEAEAKKEAAPTADGPGGPPAKPPEEPVRKVEGVTLNDLHEHLTAMRDMASKIDEASSGADLQEFLDDMLEDLERASEIVGAMLPGQGEPATGNKDEAAAMEASKTKEAEAKKEKEAEAAAAKEAEAAGPVMKNLDRALSRLGRRLGRQLEKMEQRTKAVEEQLGVLAKEPATGGARPYNDATGLPGGNKGAAEGKELVGQVMEIVKEIDNPKDRATAAQKIAERLVAGHWSGKLHPAGK